MRRLFLALLLLATVSPCWGHAMPSSDVILRLRPDRIDARLVLPIIELRLGWQKPLPMDAVRTIQQYGPALKGYVLQHVHPVTPDGRPWTVTVHSLTPIAPQAPNALVASSPDVQVDLAMTPPPGAPVDHLTLRYDVIFHRLITHTAIVSLASGAGSGSPIILGTMRDTQPLIVIDRSQENGFQGFASLFRLGMHHIAEGTDHLLFLLALLLPASLSACAGRWGAAAPVRQCVWRLLKVVTGFTVGHSCTLVAGSLGWFHVPQQPIEVLIAVSILVSAVHALRPLFPGREAYVAAGFGLIHGMSFASVLSGFHLDGWHMVQAIFAFNLGIELMQLIVVGLTVPWLILLARTPVYTPFRLASGVGAGVAALGWMCERALGWKNPVGTFVDQVAAHALWIVVGLAALSVGAALWDRICRADLEEDAEETASEELESMTLLPSSPAGTSR